MPDGTTRPAPDTDDFRTYLGLPASPIATALLLALASGAMALPFHVELVTTELTADLLVAREVLRLLDERRRRDVDFPDACDRHEDPRLAVAWVRGESRGLFRALTRRVLDAPGGPGQCLPSVWRVSDRFDPGGPPVGPALRLSAPTAGRDFLGLAERFAAGPGPDGSRETAERALRERLARLPRQPSVRCDFREGYRAPLRADQKLLVERMLIAAAAWRATGTGEVPSPLVLTPDDYRPLRALLGSLPLVADEDPLSPQAAEAATAIFGRVDAPGYPRATLGDDPLPLAWFTTAQAAEWMGRSYNTAKARLAELEGEGILVSSRAPSLRDRGREVRFRFVPGRRPPFRRANALADLPEL